MDLFQVTPSVVMTMMMMMVMMMVMMTMLGVGPLPGHIRRWWSVPT